MPLLKVECSQERGNSMKTEIIQLLQYRFHITKELAEEIFEQHKNNIPMLLAKMGV